jgi:hypothetical protein
LNVIGGLRQPVACMSFEVNLPEFLPEGLESVRRLAALSASSEFNYSADCQRGLALQRWLGAGEFSAVLRLCDEPSLEVFCRTAVPRDGEGAGQMRMRPQSPKSALGVAPSF